MGSLESAGASELLMVSMDAFIRVVTSVPALEAYVSGYAVQVARALAVDPTMATDIESH